MRINWSPLAVIAAILFAGAWFGAAGWIDHVNIEAWKDAGLTFLALSAFVAIGSRDRTAPPRA